jgi:pimeloyl-ACP methyl ester carboxylesterase
LSVAKWKRGLLILNNKITDVMKKHYRVYGNGETIVLLHGSMASKEQWGSLARVLREDYRVITIDLLGYGKSPMPDNPEEYDMKEESQHILDTLAEIEDLDCYHIVGHSYGGAVGLYHAFSNQKQVASLILYEPMSFHLLPDDHPLLLESYEMANDIKEDIRTGNSVIGAKKFIDLWLPTGTFEHTTELEKKMLAVGVKKMVHDFRSAATAPAGVEDYQFLDIPTCLLAGKSSPTYSLCIADVVASCLPNIEVHTVEGGHIGLFTHPHKTTPVIVDFLTKQHQ